MRRTFSNRPTSPHGKPPAVRPAGAGAGATAGAGLGGLGAGEPLGRLAQHIVGLVAVVAEWQRRAADRVAQVGVDLVGGNGRRLGQGLADAQLGHHIVGGELDADRQGA